MIKRILNYRNEEDREILSQKSKIVENIDEVKDLIQDLKDTLQAIPDAKGLSAIDVEQLFDRFYTVEAAHPSTGLGLSIARTLVERMGGTITAGYQDGKLTIRIVL